MSGRKLTDAPREAEVAARKLVLAAIRMADEKAISLKEACDITGAKYKTAATISRLLRDGTPEEIAAVEAGTMSLKKVGQTIRGRLGNLVRSEHRHAGRSAAVKEEFAAMSTLWLELSKALDAINSMPAPSSLVGIIKSNPVRTRRAQAILPAAVRWIEEFSNAWNAEANSTNDNHHAGNGDGNAGIEQHEPPPE